MEPKYPEVEVELEGQDGNVFSIMGRVRKALRRGGASHEEVEAFTAEMQAGDYDDALQTVFRWVTVA